MSGLAPSAPASFEFAGNVLMSNGTPPTKFVAVDEKYSCISDGARNPVLADPRSARPFASCRRVDTLPVVVDPKSL